MKGKISVIIPVYNCAPYLHECLDSVLAQTIQEMEVICIDDGSTDGSDIILKEYCGLDKRLRVFHQSNQGAGVARNMGIEKAEGDFLIFLDGDDYYLNRDSLDKMYHTCIQNDVKICGTAIMHLQNGKLSQDYFTRNIWTISAQKKVMRYQDFQIDYGYQGFLINRELILAHNIRFPNYRRFQDPPFFVRAMFASGSFSFIQDYLYCYRVPAVTARFNGEKVADLLKGLRDNIEFAIEHDLDKLLEISLMRLEYEYDSIICHYTMPDDCKIIDLLWEINDTITGFMKRGRRAGNYLLRPLKFLLEGDRDRLEHYEDYLCDEIRNRDEICLYGAGEMARRFIWFLKQTKLSEKVKKIIVTDTDGKRQSLEGIEIMSLEEFSQSEARDMRIYTAVGPVLQKDVLENLQHYGYFNVELLDGIFLDKLAAFSTGTANG
ncbi:MAG: glycosyltransferase [Clostridiales bacterium]|nr:glycosyltransferase [Clostridiales bacterium]